MTENYFPHTQQGHSFYIEIIDSHEFSCIRINSESLFIFIIYLNNYIFNFTQRKKLSWKNIIFLHTSYIIRQR